MSDKQRNRLLDYLAYLGIRLFAAFVHMATWEANYRTVRWLCNAFWWACKGWPGRRWPVLRKFEQRAVAHLRLSFPDWSPEHLDRVAKASMRNFLYLGLEVMFTVKLITPGRWRNHITLTNMAENIRLLLERPSGLIYVTGHFGNWEVVGYTLAALGFEGYAVARRLDNPYLNEHIQGVRQAHGMTIMDKRGATELMDGILEDKGYVSFIADQDAGRKGLFVDFFGRKASTYKSIALMAMRHSVPVIVGYGRRLSEQYHFEIGIQRIIYPHEWADRDDPALWITQEYTTALEEVIRTAPEQYLWTHRRWKHRPRGEPAAPDGIA